MTKPTHSILNDSFRYVPAAATSVVETWRRFGWRPTTDEERNGRRRTAADFPDEPVAAVTPIGRAPLQLSSGPYTAAHADMARASGRNAGRDSR
jgi:hypothetical protein